MPFDNADEYTNTTCLFCLCLIIYSSLFISFSSLILITCSQVPTHFIQQHWLEFVVQLNDRLRELQPSGLKFGLGRLLKWIHSVNEDGILAGILIELVTISNVKPSISNSDRRRHEQEQKAEEAYRKKSHAFERHSKLYSERQIRLTMDNTRLNSGSRTQSLINSGANASYVEREDSDANVNIKVLPGAFLLPEKNSGANRDNLGQLDESQEFNHRSSIGKDMDLISTKVSSEVFSSLGTITESVNPGPIGTSKLEDSNSVSFSHSKTSSVHSRVTSLGIANDALSELGGSPSQYQYRKDTIVSRDQKSSKDVNNRGGNMRELLYSYITGLSEAITDYMVDVQPISSHDPHGKSLGWDRMCMAIAQGQLCLGIKVTHPSVEKRRYAFTDEDYMSDDEMGDLLQKHQEVFTNAAEHENEKNTDDIPLSREGLGGVDRRGPARSPVQFLPSDSSAGNTVGRDGSPQALTEYFDSPHTAQVVSTSAAEAYGDKHKDMLKFYRIMLDAEQQIQTTDHSPEGAAKEVDKTASTLNRSRSDSDYSGGEGVGRDSMKIDVSVRSRVEAFNSPLEPGGLAKSDSTASLIEEKPGEYVSFQLTPFKRDTPSTTHTTLANLQQLGGATPASYYHSGDDSDDGSDASDQSRSSDEWSFSPRNSLDLSGHSEGSFDSRGASPQVFAEASENGSATSTPNPSPSNKIGSTSKEKRRKKRRHRKDKLGGTHAKAVETLLLSNKKTSPNAKSSKNTSTSDKTVQSSKGQKIERSVTIREDHNGVEGENEEDRDTRVRIFSSDEVFAMSNSKGYTSKSKDNMIVDAQELAVSLHEDAVPLGIKDYYYTPFLIPWKTGNSSGRTVRDSLLGNAVSNAPLGEENLFHDPITRDCRDGYDKRLVAPSAGQITHLNTWRWLPDSAMENGHHVADLYARDHIDGPSRRRTVESGSLQVEEDVEMDIIKASSSSINTTRTGNTAAGKSTSVIGVDMRVNLDDTSHTGSIRDDFTYMSKALDRIILSSRRFISDSMLDNMILKRKEELLANAERENQGRISRSSNSAVQIEETIAVTENPMANTGYDSDRDSDDSVIGVNSDPHASPTPTGLRGWFHNIITFITGSPQLPDPRQQLNDRKSHRSTFAEGQAASARFHDMIDDTDIQPIKPTQTKAEDDDISNDGDGDNTKDEVVRATQESRGSGLDRVGSTSKEVDTQNSSAKSHASQGTRDPILSKRLSMLHYPDYSLRDMSGHDSIGKDTKVLPYEKSQSWIEACVAGYKNVVGTMVHIIDYFFTLQHTRPAYLLIRFLVGANLRPQGEY